MLVSIDHLVLAVGDLDAAAATLTAATGIAVAGGGRHEALGTVNRLAWLGDSYVELVAVQDPERGRTSWFGRAILESPRGGSLATWAVRTDDLDGDVDGLRAQGARWGEPTVGERLRDDGRTVRWRVAVPDRPEPLSPFLIERDPTSAEWTAEEVAVRAAEAPARLEVLELPTATMPATIDALTRSLGLRFRPSLAGGGARDANLGGQMVRLMPAREPAAEPTIHLAAPVPEGRVVRALGCRWAVRPSG